MKEISGYVGALERDTEFLFKGARRASQFSKR